MPSGDKVDGSYETKIKLFLDTVTGLPANSSTSPQINRETVYTWKYQQENDPKYIKTGFRMHKLIHENLWINLKSWVQSMKPTN